MTISAWEVHRGSVQHVMVQLRNQQSAFPSLRTNGLLRKQLSPPEVLGAESPSAAVFWGKRSTRGRGRL